MKKINNVLLTGILLAATLISQAQKMNTIAIDAGDFPGYFKPAENIPESRLNEININAIRHFTLFFENPLRVKWYKTPVGFLVYFTCENMKKMAAYNKKGIWVHTLSYYGEYKLPGYVRHLVKSIYYDFIINQVIQLEEDNQLVYMVQMEDPTSFITVAVDDYEMKIVKAIKKQGER
ncbi:hypothetical protein FW778_02060 [Ginsengibacter hankyongi]|uniref:Uncharacterized protein n=1 Tax=Ginsengibacter hankyongi TaxID=2607284 RepID=A0A5J5IJY6_9BACT|nr:hypothetical protein [Ginsengibacter hankyongi]KAA9040848.1 hypothetical protein FW778_02060 [Ginsengibacter hankyongi]